MLVDESIWSRGVYTPVPIAFVDLLDVLGRQLATDYSDILESPLPESLANLVQRLSSGQSESPSGSPE